MSNCSFNLLLISTLLESKYLPLFCTLHIPFPSVLLKPAVIGQMTSSLLTLLHYTQAADYWTGERLRWQRAMVQGAQLMTSNSQIKPL